MESLVIENGLKTYEIADSEGNVRGTISINPSDINIFSRAQIVREKISDSIEAIELARDYNDDGIIKLIDGLDKELKEAINDMFQDPHASEVVFGGQNVLNTLNGETFIERFMNAIMPVIEKEMEKERKASKERTSKYTKNIEKMQ